MTFDVLDLINAVLFSGLAVLSGVAWGRQRGMSAFWLTVTFTILGVVTVSGLLLPADPHGLASAYVYFELALLAVFPYAMHRFASTFRSPPAWYEWLARTWTVLLVVSAPFVGSLPAEGEPLRGRAAVFVSVLLAQWAVLLTTVAVSLWRGGTGQPVVARRRMRLLAAGAVGIVVALAGSVASTDNQSAVSKNVLGILTVASALSFYCGFFPPRALRSLWQADSQQELRRATIALLGMEERQDLAGQFLPHLAVLLGALGARMYDRGGELLGSWGETQVEGHEVVEVDVPFGRMVFLTTAYTPFFGTDELALVRSMGVVIELALERYSAIEQQRAISQRLEAMNQLKNEFVAVVAHDLRSPMSVISGFARTLDDQWDKFSDEKKREILGIIAGNTESLADLVEDVLQVARIESGEFTYDMQAFDLAELADRVARDMHALDRNEIVVLRAEDELPAYGDAARIWQVMTNLVTNAMKFSAEDAQVRIELARDGDRVRASVRDSGIGIDQADHARVFEKFSRISPADRSLRVKGSGLGLYICRTIIEAHAGELILDSAAGQGSTFSFTLPLSQETTA